MLDLHLLLNTVHAPSIYNNSASASWLPICLPKFNSTGFVNTYVNFVRRDGDSSSVPSTFAVTAATTSSSLPAATGGNKDKDKSSTITSESGDGSESGSRDSERKSGESRLSTPGPSMTSIGLICVSGESDFDVIRVWGENVIQVGSCFLFYAAVYQTHYFTAAGEGRLSRSYFQRDSLGGHYIFYLRTWDTWVETFLLQEPVSRPNHGSRI